uniref:Protein E6 n=1 Tax=Human papillomavirus 35 TaxID=10587 RepID=F8S4F0_HPV35|nr:early protein E6 [human papillomavirus 35]
MFQDPAERPYKLHDLCNEVEESIYEICLNCVYCKQELQRSEVYDFACYDLCIVYREGQPYGVCMKCLKFYSKISEYRRYRYSVYGETLEKQCNKQLCHLLIRCITCQKPLCPVEKQRHLEEKKRFHNIGGRWTGRCMSCWKPTRIETEV